MAKKNSSKTATEKAIQASEPRVMSYRNWSGVSIVDAPLTWQPLETTRYAFNQTNLPKNYLMIQNNIRTTDTLALETREDSHIIAIAPPAPTIITHPLGTEASATSETLPGDVVFTGVCTVFHKFIFAVVRYSDTDSWFEYIVYRELTSTGTLHWGELEAMRCPSDSSLPIHWEDLENYTWASLRAMKALDNDDWNNIYLVHSNSVVGTGAYAYESGRNMNGWEITEIGAYEDNLVITTSHYSQDLSNRTGNVFIIKLNYDSVIDSIDPRGDNWFHIVGNKVQQLNMHAFSNPTAPNPTTAPTVSAVGMSAGSTSATGKVDTDTGAITGSHVVRVEVCYAYTTKFGSTLPSNVTTYYTEFSPTLWSSARYLKISRDNDTNVRVGTGITGIDFYGRDTENTDWVFIGHVNVTPTASGASWSYNWFGNMTDISQWTTAQLMIPTQNDTDGPSVGHFDVFDSRLYYWGDYHHPYRLYIGGNPGSEFSVARGLGGAWVDIEPGSGFEVKGLAKWKTNAGANIVTIMCGNANTTKVARFNLVETNITVTNEIAYKGYMYERVSNVVGCNSRYGFGVYDDGLYSISRYGLTLTTMAMEYNNQMKSETISDVIQPIFTDRMGDRLKNTRMVCIDGIIYIALAENNAPTTLTKLDNVIFCYDIDKKAWYTFTHDQSLDYEMGSDPDVIHHIFSIDSDQAVEGLGVITDTHIYCYPIAGEDQEAKNTDFTVLLETGELMPKEPMQMTSYIQQLEFRFDYFISDPDDPPTILVEGTDYYGRSFSIEKQLNIDGGRGNHGVYYSEQRNYTEWIRVDKYVESMRIRIKGKARFRLTHFNVKLYPQQDVMGTQWGFDARDHYLDAHGRTGKIHHYINDYNNLRRALVS